jgi:hypothetical protein
MKHDWEGEIHTLTVRSVEPPDGPFDDGDLDYEIEHPPSCTRTEEQISPKLTSVYWDCDVQHMGIDDGLAFSLRYSGTPVTEPGTYKIRAWGRTYPTEDGDEYDGSVVIVDAQNEHSAAEAVAP